MYSRNMKLFPKKYSKGAVYSCCWSIGVDKIWGLKVVRLDKRQALQLYRVITRFHNKLLSFGGSKSLEAKFIKFSRKKNILSTETDSKVHTTKNNIKSMLDYDFYQKIIYLSQKWLSYWKPANCSYRRSQINICLEY